MAQRYAQELKAELPEVDFYLGVNNLEDLLSLIDGSRQTNTLIEEEDKTYKEAVVERWVEDGDVTAYLKISEGCDNRCTYCAIPNIRGGLRSLPLDTIVKEAQQLASEGAKELCVVGQDLTVYGMDTYGRPKLMELLDALESSLPHDLWIRLLYLHPSRVTETLLERVSKGSQILPYLDIPVQHGDARILKSMNRGISDEELLTIFTTARSINPDFALRTTCMVGFPGEKKSHFDKMMDFVSKAKFDRMGAFTFFAEEDTLAYEMGNQVSDKIKEKRLAALMALQSEISFERQQLFVGREMDVLIERVSHDEGFAEGRSFREAPEVDGIIEIRNICADLKEGDIIRVKMTEAMPHDMAGEEVIK